MKTRNRILAGVAVLGVGIATAAACVPAAVPGPQVPVETRTGIFADGATWTVKTPAGWNGTVLLYSHGAVLPGAPNPAATAPDRFTGNVLLERGYALAGSSYAGSGWAVEEALDDQIAVLDQLPTPPREVLAWGSSLGGLVTAELVERHPDRIAGALPMCGVLAGGVPLWDRFEDMRAALTTLLGPGGPSCASAGPTAAAGRLRTMLDAAQETPQGRARIALVAALGDLPGWAGAGTPRPSGAAAREAADHTVLRDQLVDLMVSGRAELIRRAGGNPASTSGAARFRDAPRQDDVARLYAAAGLDLAADLAGSTPPRR